MRDESSHKDWGRGRGQRYQEAEPMSMWEVGPDTGRGKQPGHTGGEALKR